MSDDRDDRILSPDAIDEDGAEVSLRPQTLDECMDECMNSEGTDEAICSLRCAGFSNPL